MEEFEPLKQGCQIAVLRKGCQDGMCIPSHTQFPSLIWLVHS
jgi:hypothetical protein